MSQGPQRDWMISVDDHIVEPPHVWVDRLPAKYRERGPRWVSDDQGEAWLFGDERTVVPAHFVNGGIWPEEKRFEPALPLRWEQLPAGAYDAGARIEAMNTHGVIAAVVFSNYPGFAGNMFSCRTEDKDLALACIQAYNDWFLEEWCNAFPGRFIGQMLVPLWDGTLAAKEVERTAGKGARAVSFPGLVHNLGFPPITDRDFWDPFFSAVQSTGLVLNTHGGSSTGGTRENDAKFMKERIAEMIARARAEGEVVNVDLDQIDEVMRDGNIVAVTQIPGIRELMLKQMGGAAKDKAAGKKSANADHLREWLTGGVFQRYPAIRLVLSEISIAWVPAAIADMPDPATAEAIYRDHIYSAWIPAPEDGVGVQEYADRETLESIGINNVLCETDYPHTASLWPNSIVKARQAFDRIGLTDEEAYKILRGNAERIFNFTPAELPMLVS